MQCNGDKILLFGYNGKMGTVLRGLLPFENFHRALSFDDYQKGDARICIDFSTPILFEKIAETCRDLSIPLVSGTTGFSEEQFDHLRSLSLHVPVVHSSNFSLGINVLLNFLPSLVSQLPGFDIAIVEQHHRHKKDKPSGTAKALLENLSIKNDPQNPVSVHSVRLGGIIGEHTIVFSNEEEKISITHNAFSRKTFAQGALWTAKRLCEKKLSPGLYTLQDIILL